MLKIKFLILAFAFGGLSLLACSSLSAQNTDPSCKDIKSGILTFASGSSQLTEEMEKQLDLLAADMNFHSNCRVVVSSNGNSSKKAQQLSWERTYNIIIYMTDSKKIDGNRFIFLIAQVGDENLSTFYPAKDGQDGPSTVAPPHPDLSTH